MRFFSSVTLMTVAVVSMTCRDNISSAKGCATSHCLHSYGGSHQSLYRSLSKLRDSSFTGFLVVRNDTLYGILSSFNTYELKLNDGMATKRINYSRINYLHLAESNGVLNLAQLPDRDGFFRLLYSEDSIALYDRNFRPHHSMADVDMSELLFRYKNFSRYLSANFSADIRKRVVTIINQHYAANITRKSKPAMVYAVIAGK